MFVVVTNPISDDQGRKRSVYIRLNVMMVEHGPQCLLWLPILHRMTRVENGQYRYVLM